VLDDILYFRYSSAAVISCAWLISPLLILHSFDMNALHGIQLFIHVLLHQWLL